ncbi:MAG: hypothetical protein MUD00_00990 [Candidatus Pacebacteria bacterium]|nr:hypothetical protein [Candidatus Paceibacterota bacterium]
MDDIEAIIDAAKHFKYEETETAYAFNRISQLADSKSNLKRAIKERVRLLYAAYISLASFIPDEDVDYMLGLYGRRTQKRSARIVARVMKEMEVLEKEIRKFNPLSN